MRILNFLKTNNDKQKSIRIRTEIGDKFLNVNLDQTYESLDILSLKIFQKDVYRLFDADYGVIVGRVNAQGVGVPNCKVSVFIPVDEEVVTNPTTLDDIEKIEAAALYPYESVYDKDIQGKVFNLLPKYSKNRNANGFPDNEYGLGSTPKTPVGTFPEKEEILVNETLAYVYDKYYKYTTVTNESGDYILTVPANRTYTVNMSCDITDIGRYSTSPAILKLQGISSNFFTPDGLKINADLPLESLPNIDIQNKPITVKPLWSQNSDNTNVGINRLDFELIKKITPFTTVIGNFFAHDTNQNWKLDFSNQDVNVVIGTTVQGYPIYSTYQDVAVVSSCTNINDFEDIIINTKVKGELDIKVFSLKNTISEFDANILNNGVNLSNYDINNDIELLTTDKYLSFQDNGNFICLLPCNRNKVITDEEGNLITVDDDNLKGVYTSFRGYFYFFNKLGFQENFPRISLKVPQLNNYTSNQISWTWKHYKFDFGQIYTVAQKNTVECAALNKEDEKPGNQTNIIYTNNGIELPVSDLNIKRKNIGNDVYKNFYNHLKFIYTALVPNPSPSFPPIPSTLKMLVIPSIKNQWLHFSLYFMNAYLGGNRYIKDDETPIPKIDTLRVKYVYGKDINANLGANEVAKRIPNGEYIKTDFVLVDKNDLIKFYDYKIDDVRQLGFRIPKSELKGVYFREPFENQNITNQDLGDDIGEYYFLLGTPSPTINNILEYLVNSQLI